MSGPPSCWLTRKVCITGVRSSAWKRDSSCSSNVLLKPLPAAATAWPAARRASCSAHTCSGEGVHVGLGAAVPAFRAASSDRERVPLDPETTNAPATPAQTSACRRPAGHWRLRCGIRTAAGERRHPAAIQTPAGCTGSVGRCRLRQVSASAAELAGQPTSGRALPNLEALQALEKQHHEGRLLGDIRQQPRDGVWRVCLHGCGPMRSTVGACLHC